MLNVCADMDCTRTLTAPEAAGAAAGVEDAGAVAVAVPAADPLLLGVMLVRLGAPWEVERAPAMLAGCEAAGVAEGGCPEAASGTATRVGLMALFLGWGSAAEACTDAELTPAVLSGCEALAGTDVVCSTGMEAAAWGVAAPVPCTG